jgi:hypothetical protein
MDGHGKQSGSKPCQGPFKSLWITSPESGELQQRQHYLRQNSPLKEAFVMRTAAEYQAMAEECSKWAREAHTAEVRASYLQLAQVWLKAAAQVDGRPPIRMASPDTPTKAA